MGAEPLFVPTENSTSEDEGHLLLFAHNKTGNKSDLILLNA